MKININQYCNISNVSRRQLNNRIIPLKEKYPNLIIGGGRGKSGKYFVDKLLTRYICKPKSIYTVDDEINSILEKQDSFINNLLPIADISTFKKIDWRYFCCYSPAKCIEVEDLLNRIPTEEGDMVFYSIHENENLKIHVHFVTTSQNKERLLTYDNNLMDVKPFVDNFRIKEAGGCYQYLTNLDMQRYGQRVIEWGYFMGYKERKGVMPVVLCHFN